LNLRFMTFCEDILMAADSISSYLENIPDLDAYRSNKITRRAVEREFEIIGEATKQLQDEFPGTDFPEAAHIVGLRNRIIHGYADVDDGRIWSIAKTKLPELKKIIKILMERESHA
jgi:uncharacterized protein with HEPN domain